MQNNDSANRAKASTKSASAAPVVVNNGGGSEKGGGMSTTTIILIVAGAALLLFMFSSGGGKPYVYQRTEFDEESLTEAMENDGYTELLKDDKSLFVLKSTDYSLPPEELDIKIKQSYAFFQDKLDAKMAGLMIPTSNFDSAVANGLAAALSDPANAALTQKGLDLYVQAIALWCQVYTAMAGPAMQAVADIMAATGALMNGATTCVRTAYIKDETNNATFNTSKFYSTTVKNSSYSALWGLAKGGSSSQTSSGGSTTNSTQSRRIVYVPHCELWQVDPAKVTSLMAAQNLALTIPIATLQSVVATFPDAAKFFKKA